MDQGDYCRMLEDNKRIDELEEQLAAAHATIQRLQWQKITPECLPKVGDEVWEPLHGDSSLVDAEAIKDNPNCGEWLAWGWTHFRAINPPIATRAQEKA